MDNSFQMITDELENQVREHAEEIFKILHQYQAAGMEMVVKNYELEEQKTMLENETRHLREQNENLISRLNSQAVINDQPQTPNDYSTEPTF